MKKKGKLLLTLLFVCIMITGVVTFAATNDKTLDTLSITTVKTGTAPFNTGTGNPNPGEDYSDTDAFVRSYDSIAYNVSTSMNITDSSSYDVEFTLSVPDYANTSDGNKTYWYEWDKNSVSGYNPVLSDDRSTLTFTVNYSNSQIREFSPILKINGMYNGTTVTPKVVAKVKNSTQEKEASAGTTTVSSKPNLDIEVANSSIRNPYEYNGKQGRYVNVGLGYSIRGNEDIALTNPDGSTYVSEKGMTYPSGPITFDLWMFSNITNTDTSAKTLENLGYDIIGIQPNGSTVDGLQYKSETLPRGAYLANVGNTYVTTTGKVTIDEVNNDYVTDSGNHITKVTLTLSDYAPSRVTPERALASSLSTAPYAETIKYFSANAIGVFVPFYEGTVQNWDSSTAFMIKNVRYTDSNSTQYTTDAITTNNSRYVNTSEFVQGNISINARFSDLETSKEDFTGDGAAAIGQEAKLQNLMYLDSSDIEYTGIEILNIFEGSKFDVKDPVLMHDWKTINATFEYGVGNLTEDDMLKANGEAYFDQGTALTWYGSLEEAQAACGTDTYICGVRAKAANTVPANSNSTTLTLQDYIIPKDTAKVNTTYAFRSYARVFTNPELTEFDKIYSVQDYTKAEFTDGLLQAGHIPNKTAGSTSLLVLPATVTISKTTVDIDPSTNKPKNVYYIPDTNEIKWKLDTAINMTDVVASTDTVTVTDIIPKGLEFIESSASIAPTKVEKLSDGSTKVTYVLSGYGIGENSPVITYKTKIPTLTKNNTSFTGTATIDTAKDTLDVATYKTSEFTVRMSNDASFRMYKSVDKDTIDPSESFTYTLTYSNSSSSNYTGGYILDILPKNGYLNSNFTGSYTISDIVLPSGVTAEYTTDELDSNVTADNIKQNATWKTFAKGVEAKALRFKVDAINADTEGEIKITLATAGNKDGDVYYNNYYTTVNENAALLVSNIVETRVISKTIKGTVWKDKDKDGLLNDNSPLAQQTVKLINNKGVAIATTTTDDKGEYVFTNITPGNYQVQFSGVYGSVLTTTGDLKDTTASHAQNTMVGKYNLLRSVVLNLTADGPSETVINCGFINGLAVNKTADKEAAVVGETITYSIKVTNNSKNNPNPEVVTIEDVIPASLQVIESSISDGGTYANGKVTWSITGPEAGQSKIVTVQCKVLNTRGDIDNEARIVNGTEVEDAKVHKASILLINKSSNPAPGSTVKEGDVITYSITVDNTGSKYAKDIVVSDTIPSGTTYVAGSGLGANVENNKITWTIPTLPNGASTTVSFQVKVNDLGALNSKELSNVATVNDIPTNTVKHTVGKSKLNIIQTVDKTVANEGDELTYTFVIENTGSVATGGDFTCKLPEGLTYASNSSDGTGTVNGSDVTYHWDNIGVGESKTLVIKTTIDNLAQGVFQNTYTNVGKVTDTDTQEVATSNTVVTNVFKGDLYYVKSVDVGEGTIVKPGQELVYTITVGNKGAAPIDDINIKDTIPEGTELVDAMDGTVKDKEISWTIKSLAQGTEQELSFKVKATGKTEEVTNIALVDDNETNAVTNPVKEAKPEITLETSTTDDLHKDDQYYYTITVSNKGNLDLTPAVVTNVVPEGVEVVEGSISDGGVLQDGIITWDLGTLAQGESKTFTYTVSVSDNKDYTINNVARLNEISSNEVVNKVVAEKEEEKEPPVFDDEDVVETTTPDKVDDGISIDSILPKTGTIAYASGLAVGVVLLCGVVLFIVKRKNHK